jgi:hypothetical protein
MPRPRKTATGPTEHPPAVPADAAKPATKKQVKDLAEVQKYRKVEDEEQYFVVREGNKTGEWLSEDEVLQTKPKFCIKNEMERVKGVWEHQQSAKVQKAADKEEANNKRQAKQKQKLDFKVAKKASEATTICTQAAAAAASSPTPSNAAGKKRKEPSDDEAPNTGRKMQHRAAALPDSESSDDDLPIEIDSPEPGGKGNTAKGGRGRGRGGLSGGRGELGGRLSGGGRGAVVPKDLESFFADVEKADTKTMPQDVKLEPLDDVKIEVSPGGEAFVMPTTMTRDVQEGISTRCGKAFWAGRPDSNGVAPPSVTLFQKRKDACNLYSNADGWVMYLPKEKVLDEGYHNCGELLHKWAEKCAECGVKLVVPPMEEIADIKPELQIKVHGNEMRIYGDTKVMSHRALISDFGDDKPQYRLFNYSELDDRWYGHEFKIRFNAGPAHWYSPMVTTDLKASCKHLVENLMADARVIVTLM